MITIKGIEFTEKTIENALKAQGISLDKPKPKFEPRICHCLEVSVRGKFVVVRTLRDDFDNHTGCTQEPKDARKTARVLLDAANFVETNK